MASAVSRVLATPELLECILSSLPLPSLLLSRRISSHFNSLINTSPVLQQKLFLRPSASSKDDTRHINTLLRDHFRPFFAGRSHSPSVLRSLEWAMLPAQRSAFLRREASWRQMLLTSRSSRSLRVARCVCGDEGDYYDIANLHSNAGVTMGVIYDIVQSWCLNEPVASFEVFFGTGADAGEMDMTLYLEMTVQCCVDSDEEDEVSLRSEGEEANEQTLQWKKASKEEKKEIKEMLRRRGEMLKRGEETSRWDEPDRCGGIVYD